MIKKIFKRNKIIGVIYLFFLMLSVLIFSLFLYNLVMPLFSDSLNGFYKDFTFSKNFSIVEFHRKNVIRLLFLAFYFFLISIIVRSIKVETLFSRRVIILLKLFAIVNFLPFLYALINNLVGYGESWFFVDALGGNLAYLSTGFLSLFMAYVFFQGFTLQQENDLTV